jgi:hypothetical protein
MKCRKKPRVKRWAEILGDPVLARLPQRIETDRDDCELI